MSAHETRAKSACPLCEVVAGRGPRWVVHEDEKTIAFLSETPEAFGHTLIAPKMHVTGLFEAAPAVLQAVMATVQRVSRHYREVLYAEGINVLHASGEAAGQSVEHFHMHLLPRFVGDGLDAWPRLPPYHADNDDVLRRLRPQSLRETRYAIGLAASSPEMVGAGVATHLESLERSLLDPAVRRSMARVDALLSADFYEFGSSGRVWKRQEVIDELAKEAPATRTLSDFRALHLEPTVVLATYGCRSDGPNGSTISSLRSSVWRYELGTWRMAFHQATPCRAGEATST